MSNFDLAIPTILLHEGNFVHDKNDLGGVTHYGISLRWLQSIHDINMSGYLEGDLNEDNAVNSKDIELINKDKAIELYRKHWWVKYQYEKINDQTLATKVFDLSVNMGATPAHRCLQRAIRATTGEQLIEDGILGPKTLLAINTAPPDCLLAAYRSEAAGFYRSLKNTQYEKGWLNRAYA